MLQPTITINTTTSILSTYVNKLVIMISCG